MAERLTLVFSAVFHLPALSDNRAISRNYHLVLVDTEVSDAGLEHLKGLTNLTELHLEKTKKVTAMGIASLRKALPNCKVTSDFDMT